MLNRNKRLVKRASSANDIRLYPKLLQDFVGRVSVGISITDEEGKIIFWNPAMEMATGLVRDIAKGSFIWDIYFSFSSPNLKNSNTLDLLQKRFLALLNSGISDARGHQMEFEFFHQDGSQIKMFGTIFSIETAKGHCLFSVLHDESLKHSAKDKLKDSEEKFRNVVERARDGILVLDNQEVILQWNDGCEQISGVTREQALGKHLSDVMPEVFMRSRLMIEMREKTFHRQILSYLNLIARTGLSRVIEWDINHSNGKQKWIQSSTFPFQVGDTFLFGIIARDITAMKQNEEHLRHYAHQLETLRQAGLEISSELALDALIWMIASRAVELLNGTAMALYLHNTEKNILELAISLGDKQPKMERFTQRGLGLAGRVWESSKPVLLEDFHTGSTETFSKSYWGKVAGSPLIWGNEFLGVVFVFSDENFYENDLKILELFSSHAATAIRNARAHHQLSQLAITDSLTGVYNRRHFFEMAEKEFHQAVRYKHPLSVIMFDLDFFKKLNDTLGHIYGDEILLKVAQRCVTQMREADIIGRYGGEEFVIALPETNAQEAIILAERLCQGLAALPIDLNTIKVPVTASFGIATLKAEETNLMQVLNRADIALYHAKQSGRNRAIAWGQGMQTDAQ